MIHVTATKNSMRTNGIFVSTRSRVALAVGGQRQPAASVYHDPQYQARDMILECKLPDGRPVAIPGIVQDGTGAE